MRKRSVFVVFGAAGDYEDHREWTVAAYLDKEIAEAHAKLAKAEDERVGDWYREGENWEQRCVDGAPTNAYDVTHLYPGSDVGSTDFGVWEVPLRAAAPRVKVAKLPASPAPVIGGEESER
jgi:hypothetical protein